MLEGLYLERVMPRIDSQCRDGFAGSFFRHKEDCGEPWAFEEASVDYSLKAGEISVPFEDSRVLSLQLS